MARAVLISIRPEWVNKIVTDEKTVEIRKTRPYLETPFKCYMYETQGKSDTPWIDEDGHMIFRGCGKVVGEFTCDRITGITLESMPHPELDGDWTECVDIEDIKNFPAADVAPVRYGKWNIRVSDERTLCLECSECGRKVDNFNLHRLLIFGEYGEACQRYPYCHCGAKMDLEEDAYEM